MNRETKFRGKSKKTGEWVYGNLIKSDDSEKEFETIMIPIINANMYTDANETDLGVENWTKIIPETVGQYIGLKDINDKEIYEGDFVVDNGWDDEPLEIVYDDEDFAFKTKKHIKGREYFWDSRYKNIIDAKCYTIIGNIYDNPELIVK